MALDAETIAAWIANGVSAEKAGVIAVLLQRRLWQGRPCTGGLAAKLKSRGPKCGTNRKLIRIANREV